MKQLLQNMKTGQTRVEEIPVPTPRTGQALVRVAASLVSAGTERMLVEFAGRSLLGKARSRPDLVRQVLDKMRREGVLVSLGAAFNRLDQPMALGYSSAGTIVSLGGEMEGFKVGQRVACAGGGYAVHAEYNVVPRNLLTPLPDSVDFESAAFTTLGAIALHGFRLAEAQINKARARIGLAKYEYLPSFRLGLSYNKGNPDFVPAENRDLVGVQFGLSIPLWFNKNAGRLEEARAEEQKALSMKATQVNQTNANIRNLYFRLKNSERLVRLYRDQLLPQAAQAMEVAETWFREKQGSFSDFIETESAYYNFQLSLARAKADYGKYLAQIERLCGVSLVRKAEEAERKSPEERSR